MIRYDPENGKNMFEQLEKLVRIYNDEMKKQVEEQSENAEKKKKSDQPLVLAICTPLMAHAHKLVRQAGELVYIP